jgi:ABC-2 type transport system ATP-binding protein
MENPPSVAELMKIPGATKVEFLSDRQIRVYFDGDQDITERIITASVQQGWRLREINLDKGLLDDIFKQLSIQSLQ